MIASAVASGASTAARWPHPGISTNRASRIASTMRSCSERGDSVSSLAERVLDAEPFETLVRFAEGYGFSDADFAIDTVIEVGPGGHFLDQEHTLENMWTFIRETSMDRRNWDDWAVVTTSTRFSTLLVRPLMSTAVSRS